MSAWSHSVSQQQSMSHAFPVISHQHRPKSMLAATEDGSNVSIGGVVVGGSVGACVVVGSVVVVASVVVVSAVVVKFAVVVVDSTVVDAFTDANVVMKIITQKNRVPTRNIFHNNI